MSIYNGNANDEKVNQYLATIRQAEQGKGARSAMANAVQRCYELAKIRVGTVPVSQSTITEHTDRIRNAYFGEEVRDALKTGLYLCYTTRGISHSTSADLAFSKLTDAQTGEDLKNGILMSICKCCLEVNK